MRSALWLALLLACGSPEVADGGLDAANDAGLDAPIDAAISLAIPNRGRIAVTRRADGRIDVGDDRGTVYLRGAWAEALVREGAGESTLSTREACPGIWSDLASAWNDAPLFSDGEGWEWRCDAGEGRGLAWSLWIDRAHDTLLSRVTVTSASGSPERTVLRLTPLISEGEDGGLFIGGDARRHRVLDDGADVVRETEAFLRYPNERAVSLASILPIRPRGNLIANWSHAIADLDGHRHWIAGALAVERGLPTFGLTLRGAGPLDPATGRHGLDSFVADSLLVFAGKPLHPAGSVPSETIYVDPLARDPLEGLERYADAIAAYLDVSLFTDRGHAVPSGWNSWTGSGSTGGLGTDIDQTLMRECLAVMARELAPYGVDYFQIDDGYQDRAGDWGADPTRFPDGIEDLSARIEAAGLTPGIWIEALLAHDESRVAIEHPEWLRDPADSALAGVLVPDGSHRALDVSSPEVRAWLVELMRRYRDDWGMRWLKLDFAYLAFPYVPRADPELTSVEAYVGALRAIREGLGPDVFFLGVGLVGMSYGIADGMRLTLDDGPAWEEPMPLALFGDAGNLKSTVRTGSRRYFLHDRVWISHDDLLFFRTGPGAPALTLEEATTFASFIGLSGSIVKIGEDLRTLTPPQIDVVRRLLPIYPRGARPLDLFVRNYPEVWHLPVEGTLAGSDARWSVLGLLHWGRNFDFEPDGGPTEMPDEARTYPISLATLGLDPEGDYVAFEFWSERYLGVVRGTIERTIAPHGHEVIALRPALDRPQLLGTNRHFTQGATDLIEERWDASTRTLILRFDIDAGAGEAIPFEHHVYVRAPAGHVLGSATGASASRDGDVIALRFTPDAAGERELTLTFAP